MKKGSIEEALECFSLILKKRYNDNIAESGIKCSKYWLVRLSKYTLMKEGYDKGRYLFDEWKKFESFYKSLKNVNLKVINSLSFFIFNSALEQLNKDNRINRLMDTELSFMIALAYKKIGDYKSALTQFEEVMTADINNSNIICQLADTYLLVDKVDRAKLLFREAFFIEPVGIDISLIDSNIIHNLISKIIEKKIEKEEINYWIPVYARIYGVFNVFREIIPVEFGKINQEIFFLESAVKDEISYNNTMTARLINCYLWLYDYFRLQKRDDEKRQEIEKKIKNLSEDIFILLKNNEEQERK